MSTRTLPDPAGEQRRCPAFDLLRTKIQAPAPRPGSVSRTALVNRLRAARSTPVVTVVAPAGYGKSTALAQWAERDGRPFAWVSVDEHEEDPAVLLGHVAAALDGCSPLDPGVLHAVHAPGPSIWTAAVPRLAAALASLDAPTVVVLDDAARLESNEAAELLTVLAQHVPEGSTLVLSGRRAPRVPIARLRAAGRLLEIGPELLALSRSEATGLLRTCGVALSDEQTASLIDCTEGWAAGLYLAALAIRDGDADDAAAFGGDDRYLADYFRSACLSGLSPGRLDFLRRTSILEWMSGPLCDALLESSGSARELEAVEDAGLFLVPLDRHRGRFRYHGLFRDLLLRELEQHETVGATSLHRRAGAWFETSGDMDTAIGHAAAAGDMDHVAHLVGALALAECNAGRVPEVEGWLDLFRGVALDRYPSVAATGAWVHALRGRRADAERWLAAAENGSAGHVQANGGSSARPMIALVRAALCRDGAERMGVDAETAVAWLPVGDDRRAPALLLLGAAQALLGAYEAADETLDRAAAEAAACGADRTRVAALAERAFVAECRGDVDTNERLALEGRALGAAAEPPETAFGALSAAIFARALLRRSCWDEARAELETAERLRPKDWPVLPWLAVQILLELSRAWRTLGDLDRARALADEADLSLGRHPGLGVLAAQLRELRAELDERRTNGAGRESRLTTAELRLLPFLVTHLSFREIGAALFVSRNTVKTQAVSIYRKLGVSSRGDAIAEANRLGLITVDPASLGAPALDERAS